MRRSWPINGPGGGGVAQSCSAHPHALAPPSPRRPRRPDTLSPTPSPCPPRHKAHSPIRSPGAGGFSEERRMAIEEWRVSASPPRPKPRPLIHTTHARTQRRSREAAADTLVASPTDAPDLFSPYADTAGSSAAAAGTRARPRSVRLGSVHEVHDASTETDDSGLRPLQLVSGVSSGPQSASAAGGAGASTLERRSSLNRARRRSSLLPGYRSRPPSMCSAVTSSSAPTGAALGRRSSLRYKASSVDEDNTRPCSILSSLPSPSSSASYTSAVGFTSRPESFLGRLSRTSSYDVARETRHQAVIADADARRASIIHGLARQQNTEVSRRAESSAVVGGIRPLSLQGRPARRRSGYEDDETMPPSSILFNPPPQPTPSFRRAAQSSPSPVHSPQAVSAPRPPLTRSSSRGTDISSYGIGSSLSSRRSFSPPTSVDEVAAAAAASQRRRQQLDGTMDRLLGRKPTVQDDEGYRQLEARLRAADKAEQMRLLKREFGGGSEGTGVAGSVASGSDAGDVTAELKKLTVSFAEPARPARNKYSRGYAARERYGAHSRSRTPEPASDATGGEYVSSAWHTDATAGIGGRVPRSGGGGTSGFGRGEEEGLGALVRAAPRTPTATAVAAAADAQTAPGQKRRYWPLSAAAVRAAGVTAVRRSTSSRRSVRTPPRPSRALQQRCGLTVTPSTIFSQTLQTTTPRQVSSAS